MLAQRQGLVYDPNKNWSYFGDTSTNLVAHLSGFQAPADASNALFVIWVNCADLYYPAYYNGSSASVWNSAINQSQINHYRAATNLYAKGVRTLVMPNVVDISSIPLFNASASAGYIHQRCLDYNVAFANTLNQIRVACPGLTLYSPDFFSLLTNTLAHPGNYFVTNALYAGLSVDALDDDALNNKTTNGPGANYIFWDEKDPSAKVHMWMANLTQQLLSPVRISGVAMLNGSNRLDIANVPVGQDGIVLGCTNIVQGWDWKTNGTFTGASTTQSVFVLATAGTTNAPGYSRNDGPPWPPGGGSIGGTNVPPVMQLYRLSFPYAWTWP